MMVNLSQERKEKEEERCPRDAPGHLSTRRRGGEWTGSPLSYHDVDRTCIPPRPPRREEVTFLSLPGQTILNRIRLRRLIKEETSRTFLSSFCDYDLRCRCLRSNDARQSRITFAKIDLFVFLLPSQFCKNLSRWSSWTTLED